MEISKITDILETRTFTNWDELKKFVVDSCIELVVDTEKKVVNRYLKKSQQKEEDFTKEFIEFSKSLVELSNENAFLLEELEIRYKTKYNGRYPNTIRKSRNGLCQLNIAFQAR